MKKDPDEPTYYRVSPKFWVDAEQWSDDVRMVALYLLTCDHRTTEGLFRLPVQYAAADLGWSAERVREPFVELVAEGFIEWDEPRSLVLILKAMKYQPRHNPNQVKHAVRMLQTVPADSPLTCTFKGLAERFSPALAEALPEGFGDPPAQTQAPSPTPIDAFTGDNKTKMTVAEALSTAKASLGRTA